MGNKPQPQIIDVEVLAIQAFKEAAGAADKIGGKISVAFEDKVTMSVINHLWGWPWFCMLNRNHGKYKDRFIDLYKILFDTLEDGHCQRLIGTCERDVVYISSD